MLATTRAMVVLPVPGGPLNTRWWLRITGCIATLDASGVDLDLGSEFLDLAFHFDQPDLFVQVGVGFGE